MEWDGHWHLVSFEISEDQRRSRDPIAPPDLDSCGARQAFCDFLDHLSAHDEIKQANVFSAYLDAIDSAAMLSDAEFNERLYADTISPEG